MALSLHLRRKPTYKRLSNPVLFHLFSTSDDSRFPAQTESPPKSHSSASLNFSDVKASLRQPEPPSPSLQNPAYPSPNTEAPKLSSLCDCLDGIRKNLREFSCRSPPPSPPGQPISFQELYKRNLLEKSNASTRNASAEPGKAGGGPSFEMIRDSIEKLKSSRITQTDKKGVDPFSSSAFKDTLKLKPSDSRVFGGNELPVSPFGKEMRKAKELKSEYLRTYSYKELGEKLSKLRPEGKKGDWFSIGELKERLVKVREMEEEESKKSGGVSCKDLRDTILKLQSSDLNEKPKMNTLRRLQLLGQFGETEDYTGKPPKENLVEKYFHPDNMSSADKMKIELAKVRDQFKMSESDCGSARVQVAQLTAKIKHLSSVLHKKDKHSRKGLIAMVQRRKKLLKYLRRTDWDSYCFVISNLGLRDNPDYKF